MTAWRIATPSGEVRAESEALSIAEGGALVLHSNGGAVVLALGPGAWDFVEPAENMNIHTEVH